MSSVADLWPASGLEFWRIRAPRAGNSSEKTNAKPACIQTAWTTLLISVPRHDRQICVVYYHSAPRPLIENRRAVYASSSFTFLWAPNDGHVYLRLPPHRCVRAATLSMVAPYDRHKNHTYAYTQTEIEGRGVTVTPKSGDSNGCILPTVLLITR